MRGLEKTNKNTFIFICILGYVMNVFHKDYVLVDKVLCPGGNQRALITDGITQTPTPAVPLRIPPT